MVRGLADRPRDGRSGDVTRIPSWRLGLIAGAVVILAGAGIGLVAGRGVPSSSGSHVVAADPTAGPTRTAKPGRGPASERLEKRAAFAARLLRIGRHVVHIEATLTNKDG